MNWLKFYKQLTDPVDLKTKSIVVGDTMTFGEQGLVTTVTFKKGSVVHLYWFNTSSESVEKVVAKIPKALSSESVCAGIFKPSGNSEAFDGKLLKNARETRGITLMIITEKELYADSEDRLAQCMKPLFDPRTRTGISHC